MLSLVFDKIRSSGEFAEGVVIAMIDAIMGVAVVLDNLVDMLVVIYAKKKVITCLYVNNHFEGSAPRTIARLMERLVFV